MYKLSVLKDDVLLINEEEQLLTVGELNEVLKKASVKRETGRDYEHFEKERVLKQKWCMAEKDEWSPNAHQMVMNYLQDASPNEYKNGWYAQARNYFSHRQFDEIEKIMEEALKEAPELLTFYRRGEQVQILQ